MPASKLGGYKFRAQMAAISALEGRIIDKLDLAVELMFTDGTVEAAKLIREAKRDLRIMKSVHDMLHANSVDEAEQIYLDEIKPALESGKLQGKK